jgi:F420H(2)-dependent quinone reductase
MPAKPDRAGVTWPTTGQLRRTPLLAAVIGDLAVIGTVRPRRSQWIRNAAASPNVRYFRFGRVPEAQAFVFIPGEREIVLGSMSPVAQLVAAGRRAYPYSMPPLSVIPRRASIWRCKFQSRIARGGRALMRGAFIATAASILGG